MNNLKFYIGIVDSEYVSYPKTIVRANNKKEALEEVLNYWNDEDLHKNNIVIYKPADLFRNINIDENVQEIPNC